MTDQHFVFALDMSGEPPFDRMLTELARTVLSQIGYASPAIDALSGELGAALMELAASGGQRCQVRFVAEGGHLQIVIAAAGCPDWRTSRPLPVS